MNQNNQLTSTFIVHQFRSREVRDHINIFGKNGLPQILCLHGIGSTGEASFKHLAERLSGKYQLIAPDWIGCGQTTRLFEKQDTYSSDYCSEWLALFFNEAKRQGILRSPLNVLASSMSALGIAKSYATIGKYFNKIFFINPAGFDDYISKKFAFWLTNPLIPQHAMARLLLWNIIWKNILHWPDELKPRLRAGLRNNEFDVLICYAKAGIYPWGRMMATNIIPHLFEKIKHPVTILHCENDELFYKQKYVQIAKQSKGWQIENIPGSGHNLMTDNSQAIAQRIDHILKA
ncbi:MAG: alpha/beta hydrolase [Patescibacteria group bacterium]|jgi:pimeloyl-ACP methyl ester carboxylesterase